MDSQTGGRRHFRQEMDLLEHDVVDMASKAEHMVHEAVEALQTLDEARARRVFALDDEIDRYDREIEDRCLTLLALQQPMASDLREVAAVIKLITDLERIGDLAVDLARITLKIEKELGSTSYVDLPRVAEVARRMLREVIQAFVRRDDARLDEIRAMEEQVDAMYREVRGHIFAYMLEHPDEVVSAGWLLMAIHHIERVADHAMNVAERMDFMLKGSAGA